MKNSRVSSKGFIKTASQWFIRKKNLLFLITSCTGSMCLVLLLISLSTDSWLFTFKRFKNGTAKPEIYLISISSGLWRYCEHRFLLPSNVTEKSEWNRTWLEIGSNSTNCSYIDYFSPTKDGPRQENAQELVLFEIRYASLFPVFALIILTAACVLSILSFLDNRRQRLILVSAGLYVLSGISMLTGLVVYVGSVSQSFDSKARSLNSESIFYYEFGRSFELFVTSFVLSEFACISAAHLFLAQIRHMTRLNFLYRAQEIFGGKIDKGLIVEVYPELSSKKDKFKATTKLINGQSLKNDTLINNLNLKSVNGKKFASPKTFQKLIKCKSCFSRMTENPKKEPKNDFEKCNRHFSDESNKRSNYYLSNPMEDVNQAYINKFTNHGNNLSEDQSGQSVLECVCGPEILWDECICDQNQMLNKFDISSRMELVTTPTGDSYDDELSTDRRFSELESFSESINWTNKLSYCDVNKMTCI